eukprot:GABV01005356.1.p1 GENE.GABV01005356.1~~GABV01005356.1.p1  ORF type:complete len:101 (-),score=36.04 GABV01005356.1:19-321(-)
MTATETPGTVPGWAASGKVGKSSNAANAPPGGFADPNAEKFAAKDLRDADFCERKRVDVTRKEDYLPDGEFVQLFKMPRVDYAKKPAWQKTKLKKVANLF